MKVSALLAFLLLLRPSVDDDLLVWESTKPLQASDFKGEVPRFSTTAAMTSSRIHTSAKFPDRAHVIYTVTCEFDRQKSWMRPSSMDDPDLLGHEQLHFDISEYHTRLLRRELTRPMLFDDIRPRATFLRDSLSRECARWQQKYDDQTSHGTDREEQHRWKAVIIKYLTSVNGYENPLVACSIITSSPAPVSTPVAERGDSTLAEPRTK